MRIQLCAGEPRARTELIVGKLAPRLISRGPRHAHVGVTAAEMVLLDGDSLTAEIRVGAGCVLRVEDIGGTVAYPRRASQTGLSASAERVQGQQTASWHLDIQVEDGGTLLWHGLPFVIAEAADVVRRTSVRLGHDARAVLRETLVLGRHAERGGRIRSALEVQDPDGPLLLEELTVDGARPEPGVLGGQRVADTILAAGFRPPARPGDLLLEAPGALARHLGTATHDSPLDTRFQEWVVAATH
ncbi:urease accessory protein UreD [Nesterenkonia xinjiangensis]|uniref:Urease accessory protein n=1 Tax=Nesterenkonia xinjiangensis TaxID=225327 RepID=A0A7Z0GKS4_9MICC|nr:urease accessory protein UreD [Nesterenkonia xinjiangensis]NYJ77244.1 urease accessory protein [Nesterenkonia xinjiangensis]